MIACLSTPLAYNLELTLACNHACVGCANVLQPTSNHVLTDWRGVLERIAPPHNRRRYAELIRLTGGEPTLHPEFPEIVACLDTFGIPHATLTNGVWPQPDLVVQTFQKCRHLIGLLVSLHGRTAAAHGTFSGCDAAAFERTCANIRRAAEAGLEVFTNTVLTKHNCDQIEEIIALSQRLGAGYAVFNRYLGQPHPIEPTETQLHEAVLLIERLHQEGAPCHLGDCVPPCFTPNSSEGSNAGIELCTIAPNGDVRPDNLTHYTFGNIFEQSIEDIWQSERAQWFRQQIPAQCLECVKVSRCRGGARALMVEYDWPSDPLMREPLRDAEPETLELHPDWKPVPHFTLREEPFGLLVCRVNWSVPVSFEAKPLLDTLHGEATLSALHAQFGDAGLELIGRLYQEGCVEFE
jgi:radical SAM protein with 4Fe4S-binding SPASM domain